MKEKPMKEARDAEMLPLATARTELAAPPEGHDLRALFSQAIDKNASVETMKALQEMYYKDQDRTAERLLVEALAAFQSEVPEIPKTKEAKDTEGGGNRILYKYAPLDSITKAILPCLQKHGLAYSWDSTEAGAGAIKVTCWISHAGGGRKKSEFSGPTTGGTKIMSPLQRGASALTYLKRYTLINALGLTTADEDTDGMGDRAGKSGKTINDNQAANIEALMQEVKADPAKFLGWLGVASVEDIPASRYGNAVAALEKKRGA